jgi:hypothetical protein
MHSHKHKNVWRTESYKSFNGLKGIHNYYPASRNPVYGLLFTTNTPADDTFQENLLHRNDGKEDTFISSFLIQYMPVFNTINPLERQLYICHTCLLYKKSGCAKS